MQAVNACGCLKMLDCGALSAGVPKVTSQPIRVMYNNATLEIEVAMSPWVAMETALPSDLIELIAEEIEATAAADVTSAANNARGFQSRQSLKQKNNLTRRSPAMFKRLEHTRRIGPGRNWMS